VYINENSLRRNGNISLQKMFLLHSTAKEKQNYNHKIQKYACQTRELNPGHLAPQCDASPIGHEDNWMYSYLTYFSSLVTVDYICYNKVLHM